MSKPTDQELATALAFAQHMREQGKDPNFLAKSFLSHHYRIGYLQEVVQAVERFLRSGMAEDEHRRLLKLLEKVRLAEERTTQQNSDELGLG